jgi:hypothetical protein
MWSHRVWSASGIDGKVKSVEKGLPLEEIKKLLQRRRKTMKKIEILGMG